MRWWEHVWAELREGAGVFLRAVVRSALAVALLCLAGAALAVRGDPELSLAAAGFLVLVAAPLYGAVQGALLGIPLGGLAVVHHLVGPAVLLPLLGALGGLAVGGWLASGVTADALAGVEQALGARASELGSLPGARVGHPVALLILIPVLLLHFGGSPAVLGAVLWLAVVAAVSLGGGALVGLAVGLPPALLAAWGRLRARAEAREQGGPQPSPPRTGTNLARS